MAFKFVKCYENWDLQTHCTRLGVQYGTSRQTTGALGVNKVSTISGWGPNTDNLEIFINNCQSLKILECSNPVYASWILRSAYYPRIIQWTNSFAYRQYVNCTRRQHRFILLSKVKNVGENNLISFSCQMLRHILSYLLADEIEK